MKREDKASVSLKKILCISLIFFLFLAGMGVVAANANLNQVKIILSNGYEMDIVTTRTVVGEILEENHIILLPDEKVVPNQEEELSDNHTIRILKQDEEVEELADLEEVLRAILDVKGVSYEEFEKIRNAKVDERGAFKKKIFLESVSEKNDK